MQSKLADSATCIVCVKHHTIGTGEIENYAPTVVREGSGIGFKEKNTTAGYILFRIQRQGSSYAHRTLRVGRYVEREGGIETVVEVLWAVSP